MMVPALVVLFHEGRVLMEDTMEAISAAPPGPARSAWDTGHEAREVRIRR